MKQKYFRSAYNAISVEALKESLAANLVLINDLLSIPGVSNQLSVSGEDVAKAQTAVLHFLHEADFVDLDVTESELEKVCIHKEVKQ